MVSIRNRTETGHFRPNGQSGFKAKATVWSRAEQFEHERLAFVAALDSLHAAVQNRQREVAEPAYFKLDGMSFTTEESSLDL